ncbi:DUF2905 domain-containing protein [Desulfobaculum bizertense]|uniref:DUF2905 domain-containing protein n=1 Tax=Desulfobaculum bizertense DSM 18034 TaxID=1121442 RepID=A0A1T4VKP4_9BACT|nr:DUF2905 domain-containing protein [Desulfobaculum bizertense]UIJ38072.1 DUF2905 domain-containing protein [Desulfobaculum bizertense]SKA65438.1 Protein of unknown function [Desulfobaculum bizertense DSM 18034]
MNASLGKMLILLGIVCVGAGLVLLFWDKLPLSRLPLGRLPGDINIEREGFRFSFPIVTCIIVSIILSVLLSIFRK